MTDRAATAGLGPGGRIRTVWAVAAIVVVGLSLSIQSAPYVFDDAYIAFRYAGHWAAGLGPVFNPGEAPVEGFTSPLWVILLSVVAAVFGTPAIQPGSMVLGLASFAFAVIVSFVISNRARSRPGDEPPGWQTLVAPAIVAVLPPSTSYAATGMEALCFLAVVLVFAGAADDAIPLGWGCAAGALAVWVRPEGGWLPVALLAQMAFQKRLRDCLDRRRLLLVLSVAVGGLIWLLIRLAVFGSLLPNTFFAKEPSLEAGLRYVGQTFVTPWGGAVALLGLAGAVTGARRHRGYWAAGISWAAAAVVEGGDWMPFGRLLLPAFGMFSLASGGLLGSRPRSAATGRPNRRIQAIALLFLAFGIGSNTEASLRGAREHLNGFGYSVQRSMLIGKWLKESRVRSVGLVDIGLIGFMTDLEIVDLAGLTDAYIGRSKGALLEKEFDPGYLLDRRKPDVFVLRIFEPPRVDKDRAILCDPRKAASDVERRIWTDPRFNARYRLLFVIDSLYRFDPYYGYLVFLKNDYGLRPEAMPRTNYFRIEPFDKVY